MIYTLVIVFLTVGENYWNAQCNKLRLRIVKGTQLELLKL